MGDNVFLCIDLKSFYASVECIERELDPLCTNLVVADNSRTNKTICLAVSPSLKSFGISGRPRLFEVVQKVREINAERIRYAPGRRFSGESSDFTKLREHPELSVSYITATPRMALYLEYSTRIYDIYLRYVAPEDIHVYSIDEVFIDITHYLRFSGLSPHDFAMRMIKDVLQTTGITATAGIGTNMYLAKIAMDIVAKHMPAGRDGVRIAQLDEISYRQKLWCHRPITDFWRVGRGYAKKLEKKGILTMGDVARCSLGGPSDFYNEELLYKMFGVNAELLIDHAWGYEPCTMKAVKSYRPESKSMGAGQVLMCAYESHKARLVVQEMADVLALDLFDKGLVTNQLVLTVGYDKENLDDPVKLLAYKGKVKTAAFGRKIPIHAHGTENLGRYTSSSALITEHITKLYDRIVDKSLLVRRVSLTACNVMRREEAEKQSIEDNREVQLDMFGQLGIGISEGEKSCGERDEAEGYCSVSARGYEGTDTKDKALDHEEDMQRAMLDIKKRFGKNAIFRGMNLEEGATALERNKQIGGHKA